ncbi:P44/Msp2 family outer membrane protein [Ehrlichia minasensis]|uniref:P44/Msp2 family outer membrane protein n=1 Tax=Ehrlichia minasensis TaxID=1242993 RepID=A0A4Q6I4R8_9RICK|nr:P44/Msp2 family outer membrane protein [Ehrlichia minasensis]RZB12260.1 P44/Msp2 family outer membrane protein [Ehrlichia minasensis]
MNCKKIFIATALISLMHSVPSTSFSDAIQNGDIGGNFYISGKYVPSVSQFGVFSATEESNTTASVFGLKHDHTGSAISDTNPNSVFNVKDYSFKYESNPFLGFAGAIGYSMGSPRIELEILYETFDVKNQGNHYKNDAHRYCALCRQDSMDRASGKFVFLKNEGLTDISFMINACYDITTEGMPFSPYICAGTGVDLVSMFEAINIKLAYQGKLGLSYAISPEAQVFVGGHFHRVAGSEFREIPAMVPSGSTLPKSQFAIVTLGICYFGLELGGRFNF